jgi:hypothetical protein
LCRQRFTYGARQRIGSLGRHVFSGADAARRLYRKYRMELFRFGFHWTSRCHRVYPVPFTSTGVVYGVADPDVTALPEYGVSP